MNTPPTRQSLLLLKTKVKVAQKSKKLLEDKRNSLIKHFMEVINEAIEARKEFSFHYEKAYKLMSVSRKISSRKYYDSLPSFSESVLDITTKDKTILSVKLKEIEIKDQKFKANYSRLATNELLDRAIEELSLALKPLVKTIELEYTAKKLSEEIIKTRRRVNSLEHVIVPEMNENIKSISFKLSELEQSTKTMLQRVKQIIA